MTKQSMFFRTFCIFVILIAWLAVPAPAETTASEGKYVSPITPAVAQSFLSDGNQRFTSHRYHPRDLSQARLTDLDKNGQWPFAVIVTCSDSRVAPELIFDQGLGHLFVVRVAGNVMDPVGIGSVEYAVEHLNVPLVVVLGHEKCGAVKATVDGGKAEGSIGSIVNLIKPSLAKAKAKGAKKPALYEATADENVTANVAKLKKSPIIKERIKKGKCQVIGAKYLLGSGEVVLPL